MSEITRIADLEKWRDGNGCPGAAAKIADYEKRICCVEQVVDKQEKRLNMIDVQRAGDRLVMQEVVRGVLRERGRTLEGVVRLMGPYIASATAIATALIAAGKL
jgi:hypothetical protein